MLFNDLINLFFLVDQVLSLEQGSKNLISKKIIRRFPFYCKKGDQKLAPLKSNLCKLAFLT